MAAVYERDGEWLPVPRPIPLRRVVRGALLNALAYTDGHQGEAAALLELSPRAMSYALRVYAIPGARTRQIRRRVARRRPLRIVARRR